MTFSRPSVPLPPPSSPRIEELEPSSSGRPKFADLGKRIWVCDWADNRAGFGEWLANEVPKQDNWLLLGNWLRMMVLSRRLDNAVGLIRCMQHSDLNGKWTLCPQFDELLVNTQQIVYQHFGGLLQL